MYTVTLNCPNEDCQSEFEAEVTQTQPEEPRTREYPGCPAEYDVATPGICHACGCDLDTAEVHDAALRRAEDDARDAALEAHLEYGRTRTRRTR